MALDVLDVVAHPLAAHGEVLDRAAVALIWARPVMPGRTAWRRW